MPAPRACALAFAAALLAGLAHAARAQEGAPAATPTPAAAPSAKPFRVGLLVADAKNQSAGELRAEDLRVTVGGVEQSVTLLAKDESPVSYGLVVDNSGSLRRVMDAVIAAAQAVVRHNRPGDETFVVRFVGSDNIDLWRDFTSDTAALVKALDNMYVEGGQTAVFDALHLAAEHLAVKAASGGPRRRALILISDGHDRASYYKAEDVLARVREHDIQVFCIGLPGDVDSRGRVRERQQEKATAFLKQLAGETGGRAFFPEKVGELRGAVAEVVAGLHARHVVEFVPAGQGGQPASGKLEIRVAGAPGSPGRQAFYRPWSFKQGEPEGKK